MSLSLGTPSAPEFFDSRLASPTRQQPQWADPTALRTVTDRLSTNPPLVLPSECDLLRSRLAAVARGEAFLFQSNGLTEPVDASSWGTVAGTISTLMQVSVVMTYVVAIPVVTLAEVAGSAFTAPAENADPHWLLTAYQASTATLNLVRALVASDEVDPRRVHAHIHRLMRGSLTNTHDKQLAHEISSALHFVNAIGNGTTKLPPQRLFVSHEAVFLDYEDALTRVDPRTGRAYATSGHMLWIGEQANDLNGAYVEYLSKISNPIAVTVGPTATPDLLVRLIDRLDPGREPGRLTIIARMGARQISDALPHLVERVAAAGAHIAWVSQPQRGTRARTDHPSQPFADLLTEVTEFFRAHAASGSHPGGIRVELIGDDIAGLGDPYRAHDQLLELGLTLGQIIYDNRRTAQASTTRG